MKTIAYTALLYGKPYLDAAIRSIIDSVDFYHVMYSPHPSHNGGNSTLPCPDHADELYEIAANAAGDKLCWHVGDWRYENQQRAAIHGYLDEPAYVVVLDADEVWPEGLVQKAIQASDEYEAAQVCIPMVHLWRSFYRGFPDVPGAPARLLNTAYQGGTTYLSERIYHFGYAMPIEYMRYKWSGIHGHQNDLRPNWIDEVYIPARQINCHPCGDGSEYPEALNIDQSKLPKVLANHPLRYLAVIE